MTVILAAAFHVYWYRELPTKVWLKWANKRGMTAVLKSARYGKWAREMARKHPVR
jgi:hypothetical protein